MQDVCGLVEWTKLHKHCRPGFKSHLDSGDATEVLCSGDATEVLCSGDIAQWLELSVINSGDVDVGVTKPTYCARYYPGRQPVTYVRSVLNLCIPKLSLVSAI
ncbi:unnamed protein product [Boreogadus saida]